MQAAWAFASVHANRVHLTSESTLQVLFRAAVATLALWAGSAAAQVVHFQLGTTGGGAEIGFDLNDHFGIRGSFGAASMPYDITEAGIRYDTRLKPRVTMAAVDWRPFAGVFRISAGLAYNDSRIQGTADTPTGTIVLNNVTYDTSDIGTVEGEIRFRKTAPYLGIGWESARRNQRGLRFTSDLGVLYSPATGGVTGTCAPFLAPPVCAALQTDLRAEAREFQREVERYKYYPVIRVGIGYAF